MEGNIDERLDRVRELLKVNIRMFCYEAKDEMRVRHFTGQIMADQSLPCHLIEKNLYEIFLSVCEDKRILPRMADMEAKKGKENLQKQIEKAVSVQAYVDKICDREPEKGISFYENTYGAGSSAAEGWKSADTCNVSRNL